MLSRESGELTGGDGDDNDDVDDDEMVCCVPLWPQEKLVVKARRSSYNTFLHLNETRTSIQQCLKPAHDYAAIDGNDEFWEEKE